MKKSLSASAMFLVFIAGCTNLHEQRLEIYENAVADVYKESSLESVTVNLLEAEAASAHYLNSLTPEEKMEFNADSLCDCALEAAILRDSLFVLADKAYARAGMHSVEKRTVLYEKAAGFYSKASSKEELEAVREVVSVYSEKAYLDGERTCDPPKQVRDAYKSAKDLAAKGYSEALERIGKSRE